ncbi:MAG TPA: bifunctional 4-hydroxy-2-oxoglutarate aldolase/2-dehydro-3-deoxy-phosphogluconate aldolase [Thermodesulfobacteriota bacterium]|nr:bifunctional 4-hydroxy-2-oxoglutarate aldolase/2-dehydro-3-deoxy-phosphogluconate aldolase [Thermodesulfobacteriota bacterium]
MNVMDGVRKHKVFAVIRAEDSDKALEFAEACIEGGLKLIEITFSFPETETVIRKLSEKNDIFVGAGTVLNLDMAKVAVNSGAKFLVSPHTDKEIISYAKSKGLMVVSGALTSNEILTAWNLGADMVKVFPVKSVGGASYIKAVKEPLPFIEIMTTGGVTVENLQEFLQAGATAVGLSSTLTGRDKAFNPESIRKRASKAMEKLRELEINTSS